MAAPGDPNAPRRRTPSLGSLSDLSAPDPKRTQMLLRPAAKPNVVGLVLPAARTRRYEVDVPLGVTVYEYHPRRGVRLMRHGGAFWSPELIPQQSLVWGFRTQGGSEAHMRTFSWVEKQEAVIWSRSRERMVPGRHPLEFEANRKYLRNLLERAVQAELERKGLAEPEPDDDLEEAG